MPSRIVALALLSLIIVEAGILGFRVSYSSTHPVLPGITREFSPLSGNYFSEYTVPNNSAPNAIVADSQRHALWFTEYNVSKIAEFYPQNGSFHNFIVPWNSTPDGIALDSLGRIWFTDYIGGNIGMLDPSNGSMTKYPISTPYSKPVYIIVDNQSNVWFTEVNGSKMGVLRFPTLTMSEYPLPTGNSGSLELASQLGSRYIWVTETYAGKLARFDTTTHIFQEFQPPTEIRSPFGIVLDAAGNVWFTEHGGSSIVEFTPPSSLWIRYPTSVYPGGVISAPAPISLDAKGRLWFLEHFSNKIGRLDPATLTIQEFVIPSAGAYSIGDTIDSQGNFWFTEVYANKIGMILANATSPLQATPLGEPSGVTAGQTASTAFLITNHLSSPINLSLTVSSSFRVTGETLQNEVSLNASTITLGPHQNTTIQARITPPSQLSGGFYAVSLAASNTNSSSVAVVFIQVQANPLQLISQYLPEIGVFGLIAAGYLYYFASRRRHRASRLNAAQAVSRLLAFKNLIITTLSVLVVSLFVPIPPSFAKCLGAGGSSTNGGPFDAVTIAFVSVGVVAVAFLVYLFLRDNLRKQKPAMTVK